MRLRITAVAIAAVIAAGALAGCSDETQGDKETLKLTEPGGDTGSFGSIGTASQSGDPGSGFARSTPLQDSSQKTVGRIDAICIVTEPSRGRQIKGTCTATATVPDGTLALNLGGTVGQEASGAIVGGTGKYEGATGSFASVTTDGGASEDTFEVTLP